MFYMKILKQKYYILNKLVLYKVFCFENHISKSLQFWSTLNQLLFYGKNLRKMLASFFKTLCNFFYIFEIFHHATTTYITYLLQQQNIDTKQMYLSC